MSEDELDNAMLLLQKYCHNTECENCYFAHIHCECGLHNPSNWKGKGEWE